MEFGNVYKIDTFINPGKSVSNNYPASAFGKENPSITQLADGGHVIIWESLDQDSEHKAIIGRLYNADGTIQGGEFYINSTAQGSQMKPKVAGLKDGGFVAVWDSPVASKDGNGGVLSQRFDSNGVGVGVETIVGNQNYELLKHGELLNSAEIMALEDGGYAITWYSNEFDIVGVAGKLTTVYGDKTVKVQIFNADNSKRGEEISILLDSATIKPEPYLAQLENGGLIVAYVDRGPISTSFRKVSAQLINVDGSKNGEAIEIGRGTNYSDVAVMDLANGGFLVATQVYIGTHRIIGQLFNAAGEAQGSNFFISRSYGENALDFELAKLHDGSIIAVWQRPSDVLIGGAIYGHKLDAEGNPFLGDPNNPVEGADFLIYGNDGSSEAKTLSHVPSVAAFGDNGYVTVWHGGGNFLGGEFIFSRIYDENGTDGGINDGIGSKDETGTADNDVLNQIFGNVTLKGEAGNDKLVALRGVNDLDGGTGRDFLLGGIKGDDLSGGDGNDVLIGDASKLRGGADRLDGGKGDDALMGGQGADIFVFNTNDGNDFIASFLTNYVQTQDEYYYVRQANITKSNDFRYRKGDFEVGVDHVELHGFSNVNAGNVMSFIDDAELGAVFSAQGTEITFYDVLTSQLSADDFLFV